MKNLSKKLQIQVRPFFLGQDFKLHFHATKNIFCFLPLCLYICHSICLYIFVPYLYINVFLPSLYIYVCSIYLGLSVYLFSTSMAQSVILSFSLFVSHSVRISLNLQFCLYLMSYNVPNVLPLSLILTHIQCDQIKIAKCL